MDLLVTADGSAELPALLWADRCVDGPQRTRRWTTMALRPSQLIGSATSCLHRLARPTAAGTLGEVVGSDS